MSERKNVMKTIYIKGKKYYYKTSYTTWKEAYNVARLLKRKNRCMYFILSGERGYWFPQVFYHLYLSKKCN